MNPNTEIPSTDESRIEDLEKKLQTLTEAYEARANTIGAIRYVVETQSEHFDVHLNAIRDVKDDIHLLKLHIRALYVLIIITTLAIGLTQVL